MVANQVSLFKMNCLPYKTHKWSRWEMMLTIDFVSCFFAFKSKAWSIMRFVCLTLFFLSVFNLCVWLKLLTSVALFSTPCSFTLMSREREKLSQSRKWTAIASSLSLSWLILSPQIELNSEWIGSVFDDDYGNIFKFLRNRVIDCKTSGPVE